MAGNTLKPRVLLQKLPLISPVVKGLLSMRVNKWVNSQRKYPPWLDWWWSALRQMFDFIGEKPTRKSKVKSSGPESNNDGPNSLLDVVVPFPQVDENPSDRPPASLLSQIDALSRKHDENVAGKRAMERVELRAKRMEFERQEQAIRIKADEEASRRFRQKADFLDEEIERVRLAKMRELNAAERMQAPATTDPEPALEPENRQYAPQHAQSAPPYERGDYLNTPPQSPMQPQHDVPPMQPQHGMPPGYMQAAPEKNFAPQPIAPATQPRKPGYASWPSRENVPEGRAIPPAQEQFAPQQQPYNQYQPAPDHRVGAEQAGWGQGSPAAPRQNPEYRQADNYPAASPSYPAREAQPYQTTPHDRQPPPYPTDSAGIPQNNQGQQQMPGYAPVAEAGLYDSAYEAPPPDRQFQQRQSEPNPTALDLDGIIRTVFGSWKLIGFMAIIGAVLAAAYSMTLANKYQAWAELIIDPSDLKVLENQLSPTGYSGDAMIAYLKSQQRIIESSSVLKQVIVNEQLMSDKEFNSENSGILGWWDIILPAPRSERDANQHQLVLENLRKSLVVSRGNGTFVYSIGITTEDGLKSAKIANAVASAYVEGEAAARSKVATDTSGNLEGKLKTLEENVRQAEQKVADYKAEHKIFSSEGKLTSEVQLSRLNVQLANAKVLTINAKTRMEQAQATNLADVISGSLPTSLKTNTISQLRVRYALLKSNADKLATKLGPRHPERIAAQAELSSARRETSKEIKRIISGTSKEFQRSKKRQQDLSVQVMALKAASVGVSSSLIELHQLERDLAAHQRVYENFLLRSRETGEQEGIASANARIISIATAPLKKIGPPRRIIAVMGMFGGGAMGLVLALLGGIIRSGNRSHDEDIAEAGRQVNPQDAAYVEGDRGPYAQDRYAQPPQMQPQPYPPHGAQRPNA